MAEHLTSLDQADLLDRVQDALKYYSESGTDSPFSDLFLFRQIRGNRTNSSRQITNDILRDLVAEADEKEPKLGYVLRERFIEGKAMYMVARQLDLSEATAFRRQKDAIAFLAQLLYNREVAARSNLLDRFMVRLEPSTNTRLFGVDDHLQTVYRHLLDRNEPWLILLAGMGGIGKTTLADALIRHAINHYSFDEYAWVSARRERFSLGGEIRPMGGNSFTAKALLEQLGRQILPAGTLSVPFNQVQALAQIKAHLNVHPGLIVVDNLETIQDVETLLPTLETLANPSKFLLTSRTMLDHSARVFTYPIPPLAQADALDLVRYEAKSRNLAELAGADAPSLRPIYETVGGNPLALRLVVGQATLHSLAVVLSALKGARGRSVEHLYTFIYRQAWDNLDEAARMAFLSMPLVPTEGGDLDFIGVASALAPDAVMDALARLVRLNLVDHRRSTLDKSRYTIHPLTRSFLEEQVAKWQ
jgi:DNA polymerase III delta prime subunit